MNCPPTRDATCAIVVTHNPVEQVASHVREISLLSGHVLVVDNHTRTTARHSLESLSKEAEVTVLWNPENLGVAAALNQGCAWALARGYAWVLLFDQDSRPEPDLLKQMEECYADYPDRALLAAVGANHRDPKSLRTADLGGGRRGESWVEVKSVITSGCLLPLVTYREVGPFREEFFIDEVDHEFCLRARARGFRVILTRRPLLEHGPGRVTVEKLAGRAVHPTHHPPVRWYYMTRNHVIMIKEYLHKEPGWVLSAMGVRARMVLKMLLFEESKGKKLIYAWRGLLDGLRNRMGRLSEEG